MKPLTSPLGRLLSASQAARLLGIGDDKIRSLIHKGEIAAVRSATGRLSGVYEADAIAWRDRARTATPASSPVSHDVDEQVDALIEPDERVF